ncbi:TrbI F-type domain-containing protein [Candidatus Manganitrophus noduliformans]|uniref:Uncharacterized protein n=1 Tax=Candidatus Manganitrophus noduliformans TaxID=2606439 RepID=A0A7X6DT30_9BACT|nr:TrbI F-type domain-containing protein [Candidatus Manganitrophus noduliformans]NKE72839.1 hypothetical protein [Candidatus Manganitrophus noduliformans]
MFRVIAVGFVSAMIGSLVMGAVLIMKLLPPPEPRLALATVDLVGIVERLRAGALKEAADPEGVERAVARRMDRLAQLLSEMGEERVILNRAAVVSRRLPDLTRQIEERLKEKDE